MQMLLGLECQHLAVRPSGLVWHGRDLRQDRPFFCPPKKSVSLFSQICWDFLMTFWCFGWVFFFGTFFCHKIKIMEMIESDILPSAMGGVGGKMRWNMGSLQLLKNINCGPKNQLERDSYIPIYFRPFIVYRGGLRSSMYKDCRGPTLLICSISCHIMPHHAIRLLKNCKPALIPSSIAEVRFTFDSGYAGSRMCFFSVKNPISSSETENGWLNMEPKYILCTFPRWWTTPEGHHLRIWRLIPVKMKLRQWEWMFRLKVNTS